MNIARDGNGSAALTTSGRLRVLGVDPGLAATGFGVAEGDRRTSARCDHGCVRTRPCDPLPQRLALIFNGAAAMLERWQPDLMVMERVYSVPGSPQSALLLAHVRGVICLAAARAGVELMEITPAELKASLTASGRADKAQLEMAVRRSLGLTEPIRPSHASDALALAIAGLRRVAATKR